MYYQQMPADVYVNPLSDRGFGYQQLMPLLGMGSNIAQTMGYGNVGTMLGYANQLMGKIPSNSLFGLGNHPGFGLFGQSANQPNLNNGQTFWPFNFPLNNNFPFGSSGYFPGNGYPGTSNFGNMPGTFF
ncbi:hypothetical protein ACFO4N_15215 [Camelliibacillus cellulosilyticus]|uniref:Uncharacterized protein n=1 Tax=Camelliibacillus cellulosilyticus TaxID=2174486 RepID=A0ABV9GS35_9BACL